MSNRKALASAVAAALLAACGMARAESPLSLDDAPAKKPLGDALDRVGAGKTMDDAHLTVGGYVEASWTVSDSSPPANNITGRTFDYENQDLTLNQIDVYLERKVDASQKKFDVGGRLELMYGGDARGIHSLGLFDYHGTYNVPAGTNKGPDEQFDPVQMYLDFALPVGNGLQIRAGKFVTLLGLETINPTTNAFYSHSFLFGYAIPFTNTGVLATYALDPSLSVTAGVTRGWDTSTEDDNDTIDMTGQVAWTINSKQSLIVNFIIGPDQPFDNDNWREVLDVIYTQTLSDQLSVAVNADYGYQTNSNTSGSDCQWYGVAGYAGYKVSDMFTLNGRLEYFNDDDGYRGLGTSVYEATVGVCITPMPNNALGSNLKIRPEVRYDYGKDPVFDGGTGYSQATFGVDAIFSF